MGKRSQRTAIGRLIQRRRIFLAAYALAPALGLDHLAKADSTWSSATDGNYFDSSNWSNGVPSDNAYFGPANGAYTVTFTNDASVDNLYIESGSSPTFQLNGYTYSVTTYYLTVGGLFNGVANNGNLTIANGTLGYYLTNASIANGSGVASMTQLGGSIFAPQTLSIGVGYGNATYSVSNGAQLSTSQVTLAGGSASTGVFNLYPGGSVSISTNEIIGQGGTATFIQTGGSNSAPYFTLAEPGTLSAIYIMTGGNLTASGYEQFFDNSTFTQSGGVNSAKQLFVAGMSSPATYNLSNGASLVVSQAEMVGYTGSGSMVQTGGQNTAQTLQFGYAGYTSVASYDLSGGVLNVTGAESAQGSARVTFVQSGGINTCGGFGLGSSATSTYAMSGTAILSAGSEGIGGMTSFLQTGGCNSASSLTLSGNAVYDLGNASVLSASSSESLGSAALFSQTGGSNATAALYVGAQNSTAATYQLSGGTLNVSGTEYIGYSGPQPLVTITNGSPGAGTFSQSGGLNTTTNLNINYRSAYTLSGGTLTATSISVSGNSVFNLNGGALNVGSNGVMVSGGGTMNLNGGNFASGSVALTYGTLYGTGNLPGFVLVNGGTIQHGQVAKQSYAGGLDIENGFYFWELGTSLKDNTTGTPSMDFDQLQITGGAFTIGQQAAMVLLLDSANTGDGPGGANKNPFWNSSHAWTVVQLSGSASNSGQSNFPTIYNGQYSAGNFATQLNADGKSVDLVYNEINIEPGIANNRPLATVSPSGGTVPSVSAIAGGVTSGSFAIPPVSCSNGTPISVLMDVQGSSNTINQWFSEMRGVQLADGPGYSISEIGPGFPAPACGEVPSGDDGFLFTFNNTNAAGTDLYLNFDWGAGNSGVTLDQVFVAPEPSVVGFLGFGIAAMLKRRRRYTRTRS